MRIHEKPYKKPPVIVPNNEGKACDAVVNTMERRTRKVRYDIRHPERDRVGPPVELRLKLGEQEFAIEHTIIEPFENNINAESTVAEIRQFLIENLAGQLLDPMYYVLQVSKEISLPRGNEKRVRALRNLAEWVIISAQTMFERITGLSFPIDCHDIPFSPYCFPEDSVKDKPRGLNCNVELLRWRNGTVIGRKPGFVQTVLDYPKDLESLRTERIRRAFSDKIPKLAKCSAEGARTVLILESQDAAHTRFDLIGNQLPALLAEQIYLPDEIFLVESNSGLWWVYPMKYDKDHWPEVGMPQWNRPIYHPDNQPTAGIPKWHRDALHLDEEYEPYLTREWVPATYEEEILEDMTSASRLVNNKRS